MKMAKCALLAIILCETFVSVSQADILLDNGWNGNQLSGWAVTSGSFQAFSQFQSISVTDPEGWNIDTVSFLGITSTPAGLLANGITITIYGNNDSNLPNFSNVFASILVNDGIKNGFYPFDPNDYNDFALSAQLAPGDYWVGFENTGGDIWVRINDGSEGGSAWTYQSMLGTFVHEHGPLAVRISGSVGPTVLEPTPWDATPKTTMLRIQSLYPNPFNPSTTIAFVTMVPGTVSLYIYDVAGRLVAKQDLDGMSAGSHQVRWDGQNSAGRNVPSGTYLLRLETFSGESQTVKGLLIR